MPSSGIIVIIIIYVLIKPLQGQSQKQRNIETINYSTDSKQPKYNSQRASLVNKKVKLSLYQAMEAHRVVIR
jgi:hypothetical protein